jgi:hypothetical protein
MRPALLVVVACLVGAASGLTGLSQALRAGAKSVKPSSSRSTCGVQEASRRHLLLAGAAALPVMGSPIAAIASGGATAGKTTSIPRAKLRYYDRITGAITAFEALGGNLGETSAIKKAMGAFFSTQEDSPYSELKGAGFLLAVAFKIDTKIPPDKIPAVKDYKAMMKDLEGLKGVNVKKPEAAQAAYAKAKASMNSYLEAVELPPLGDQKYAA